MSRPVFFVDRSLGEVIFPDLLTEAGVHVERHRAHFADDEDDEVWIAEVARRGWFALSNDKRIHVNPVQRQAVLDAGLGYFVLTGANATAVELADNFVGAFPRVERFIAEEPLPFIASVRRPDAPGRSGRVVKLHPRTP